MKYDTVRNKETFQDVYIINRAVVKIRLDKNINFLINSLAFMRNNHYFPFTIIFRNGNIQIYLNLPFNVIGERYLYLHYYRSYKQKIIVDLNIKTNYSCLIIVLDRDKCFILFRKWDILNDSIKYLFMLKFE